MKSRIQNKYLQGVICKVVLNEPALMVCKYKLVLYYLSKKWLGGMY